MTTVETARRSPAARRMRALTQMSAVTLTAALAMTGCAMAGTPGGYVDLYFDNGNPIYSPRKADLFDEAGTPLCEASLYLGRLESRVRPFSDTGGLLNSFLWELSNPNIDPDTPLASLDVPSGTNEAAYRETLRRRAGGLERMYELTHPTKFDAERGIESPEDMAAIRDELARRLPALAAGTAPSARFITPGASWIETDIGRFETRRPGDVELFIDTVGANVPFNGLENDYLAATRDGEEFVLVRSRLDGEVNLYNAAGELRLETIEQYQEFGIMQTVGVTDSVAAVITVFNDGCVAIDDRQAARWWIIDIQNATPTVAVQDDEEDEDETEEVATEG